MSFSQDQQKAAIEKALKELGSAAKGYLRATEHEDVNDSTRVGRVDESRSNLVTQAMEVVRAARGPVGMLLVHMENFSQAAALRSIMEMGIPGAIPTGGKSITAAELAAKLKKDEGLIVRLMRLTTVGIFAEVGPQEYTHTPYSEVYLLPQPQALFKILYDEYLPAMVKLHEWLRLNDFQQPIDTANNPYTYAHDTKGVDMWTHLSQSPEKFSNWNLSMNGVRAGVPDSPLFPFQQQMGGCKIDENTVAVVDIGGGRGNIISQIRNNWPGCKGKFILQDQPGVIDEISDALPGIEKMGHDFFTPQPVKGALAYHIRRCLHDHADSKCITILKQIASAMERGRSRLMIVEHVVPSFRANLTTGGTDLTMMTFTGKERTEQQWHELLDASGLKIAKVWQFPGTTMGVVEAELK